MVRKSEYIFRCSRRGSSGRGLTFDATTEGFGPRTVDLKDILLTARKPSSECGPQSKKKLRTFFLNVSNSDTTVTVRRSSIASHRATKESALRSRCDPTWRMTCGPLQGVISLKFMVHDHTGDPLRFLESLCASESIFEHLAHGSFQSKLPIQILIPDRTVRLKLC